MDLLSAFPQLLEELPDVTLGNHVVGDGSASLVLGVETGEHGARILDPFRRLTTEVLEDLDGSLELLADDWRDGAIVLPAPPGVPFAFVILVGLGDPEHAAPEVRLRRAAGLAARSAARQQSVIIALPVQRPDDVAAVIEGALLGGYVYRGLHRPGGDVAPAPAINVLYDGIAVTDEQVAGAVEAARATRLARTLVELPPNLLHPESFARLSVALGERQGLDVRTWDTEALRSEGFGGLVGVGQGSSRGPALVRVDYTPDGDAQGSLALVGKGITFDSGGINLKLSDLDYMNFDMAGAAAVLATVLACARLALPVRVTAWLTLAENVPSGTSQRPSDVLTIRDGTTVEVRDTDAEGRLVLADAIVAAAAERPDVIVDIATLTGAQQIALGNQISAVMSNDVGLARELVALTERIDEPAWHMPLPVHLARGLKSRVADIANKAERAGGMLSAALFLQHFVSRAEPVPKWAHLDICGPAINRGEAHGFTPVGATGVGARTLLELARAYRP